MFLIAHNGSSILGGGEIWTALLLQGLAARGHRVLLLCRDRRMRSRFEEYGIPAEVLHIGGAVMLPDALRLAARLRHHAPDVLLLTTFKKAPLAGLGAWLAGTPRVVQRVVLSTDVPRSAAYRFAFRRFVDRIILNAASMRAGFLASDSELDAARVEIIHDGVHAPIRRSAPGSVRRELGLAEGTRVIGSVTRLAKQKRLDRLIRAFALLPSDVHCILAGSGEAADELAALATELGVAQRVHFLGFRSDTGDVLDAIDVFVVSSDREGMANAMLEAMAAGVPVVSTRVSGAEEALAPAGDGAAPGFIVDFSPEALADALRRLIDDGATRARMGRIAALRAVDCFGFDGMVDAWEAVLGGASEAVAAGR